MIAQEFDLALRVVRDVWQRFGKKRQGNGRSVLLLLLGQSNNQRPGLRIDLFNGKLEVVVAMPQKLPLNRL
jgi:hypothetical protein